ncbi:MAG: (2Fe-2S)-binding protein [Gammaproteobacteria bacterium]|nr:(2Fe-2S)-binding protein [Gammaproteobacteria bacterium]
MFRLLDNNTVPELIEIEFDGETVQVPADISLAAAMFYLDALPSRLTRISASPRAPFCMMGICFECNVDIEGLGVQRACQLQVYPGMQVTRQLTDFETESES